MARAATETAEPSARQGAADVPLERGTYEIIRSRLAAQGQELRRRLEQLNTARREVFGSIETRLLATERITTAHNCIPRDMVAIGPRFVFGYNVRLGLKSETDLGDVFSVQRFADGRFHEEPLELIADSRFEHDFHQLYRYYKNTTFAKFAWMGPYLHMVFQIGRAPTDVKTFKWARDGDRLVYVDNRSDHDFRYPTQHEFEWQRTSRDQHRGGQHPHISIEDRLFVETVGGDLTIKVEDNTESGEGIYAEPVDDPDQTLDDAEIHFASLGNIVLLKIRPYQEKAFRYIAYNAKIQKAIRLDAIETSCVLLPEGAGLIFSNGYYLQSGEHKTFDADLRGLVFERRIQSPNGEDYLYVFYSPASGVHVLLSYNVIEQRVATPIVCHGFSIFDNGHLAFFKSHDEPQKHHPIQIWQTPYVGQEHVPQAAKVDSYLFKVGNRDIVRGMAECHEILNLIQRDDTYGDLYVDLVKAATDVLDSYFWIGHAEAFTLGDVLGEIRDTAKAAVEEFDKVVRVRRNTQQQFDRVAAEVRKNVSSVTARRYEHINDFVSSLADLRRMRGEVIGLCDLRYVDRPAVDRIEEQIVTQSDRTAARCVDFLLRPDSLAPYDERVEADRAKIEALQRVAEARELDEELQAAASELEMLIDIVSNLKIDDATERTRIIDNISSIFSKLNQARAGLKRKMQELLSAEGAAEFGSQMKLLGQAVVNYLDVCDAPERCDEYLTKVMVQIEELEGRFAEFDEFIVELSEKREEIYAAFDARKLALVEARNKRATALLSAADRILKGIATRVATFQSVADIHSYFASDLMIERVRQLIAQLEELDDAVKVDDIQTRLKTIREDAVRQLRDRQELFVEGQNVIRLGKHLFSVNTQPLDLTMVLKDSQMYFHLTGTSFMERVDDVELLAMRDVWSQEIVSENRELYRGEYLAYQMQKTLAQRGPAEQAAALRSLGGELSAQQLLALSHEEMVGHVQKFMSPRYAEGYVKGVHDHDAAIILRALLDMSANIGLLRYPTRARALATVFWCQLADKQQKAYLTAKLKGVGTVAQVFPSADGRVEYVRELHRLISQFAEQSETFSTSLAQQAAEYLFDELTSHGNSTAGTGPADGARFSVSQAALAIVRDFHAHLERKRHLDRYAASLAELKGRSDSMYLLLRNWVQGFLAERDEPQMAEYVDEAAALLLDEAVDRRHVLHGSPTRELAGLVGSHPMIQDGTYRLDYTPFMARLRCYEAEVVPRFERYLALKKELLDRKRDALRLDEFRPKVLTSFVRNQLLDRVYLPMIGDNLAKQIGAAGDQKRTDRSGLLLLISPPGYGKTTLVEYVANRLGMTMVKVNGPAIGHQVTSLDPNEAPNASAREEIQRLNLALEMGDNVMIYVDDIQHCNPEFLQKFIPLCDAQRRIEGVYNGRTRTYDLRGRKVAVVMAGNPYTESGEKFNIPDMLSNRADTYNLGDVIGGHVEAFHLSYLENAAGSNPALHTLASRSQKDVPGIVRMAQSDSSETVEMEGNYSIEDLNEFVAVMKKLFRVREVLLEVNAQYIRSAAQADDYRTEPPFKLQGSYRDMARLAEKVVPIMNDAELELLIDSHYLNQAQTLTTGAEANLLKLKELRGKLTPPERERWESIKRTFQRNVVLRGVGGDDKFAQAIAQLSTLGEQLGGIGQTLSHGLDRLTTRPEDDEGRLNSVRTVQAIEHLRAVHENLAGIRDALSRAAGGAAAATSGKPREQTINVINRVPRVFLDVIQAQFQLMQNWMSAVAKAGPVAAGQSQLQEAVAETLHSYQQLVQRLDESTHPKTEAETEAGTEIETETGAEPQSETASQSGVQSQAEPRTPQDEEA